MIGFLQRVSRASVAVDGREVASIGPGILVLVGVERGDASAQAARLAERLLTYRVFPDEQGRMNLSVLDVRGGVLLVPQFTLAADTRKGTRASFTPAAEPAAAQVLFDELVAAVRSRIGRPAEGAGAGVGAGIFGADMKVSLVNDGPVSFWLQAD